MDYLPEEILFVRFCADQDYKAVCDKGRNNKCPQWKECKGGNRPCAQMLSLMEKGEDPPDKHKSIIKFWQREAGWNDNCVPSNGEEPCPNVEVCRKGVKEICLELLNKLGVDINEPNEYEPYEYNIHEIEVQKVIINSIRNGSVNWHLDEDLEFLDEYPHIEGVGEPDILLRGIKSKRLYVVELKVVEASREHVGQLASYVGWYKENPRNGCEGVKGILLAPKFSKSAEYALKACTDRDLEKLRFDLHVEIKTD